LHRIGVPCIATIVRIPADLPAAPRTSLLALAREWLLPSRTMQRRLWPPALGFAYIGLVAALGGLRPDHVLIGLLGLLDLYNERTRLFLRQFLPFIATGVIFDSMRYFYWPAIEGRVHVAGPYLFERRWFGIGGLTPNEWLDAHRSAVLDLACGFAYLVFVGEYLAIAFLLFFRGRLDALRTFALCFLLVNLLGFLTYYVYPVAPPWYVATHGFGPVQVDAAANPAALARWDALTGIPYFQSFYAHATDVFGAMPSMHCAYPMLLLLYAFELRRPGLVLALGAFEVLMCFSAVYLQHHYVSDVLVGIAFAVVAYWIEREAGGRRAAPAALVPGGAR